MFSRYRFAARVTGQNEVWVAARIDPADLDNVRVVIGDQILRCDARPLSLYDGGFGWYRFGSAVLPPTVELQLMVDGGSVAPVEFDAVVLSPGGFQPDGIRQPSALR